MRLNSQQVDFGPTELQQESDICGALDHVPPRAEKETRPF